MDVLLDTNIYRSDLALSSSWRTGLKAYLKQVNGRLILPEVVEAEVKNKMTELASQEHKLINDSKVKQLGLLEFELDAQSIENSLKDNFNKEISELPHHRVGYEGAETEDLVKRAIYKKPPFRGKETGLRDTVIWLTLIHYLKLNPDNTVALITSDNDFISNGELKPELAKELEVLGLANKVILFKSVNDFLTKHLEPIIYINNNSLRKSLESAIKADAEGVGKEDLHNSEVIDDMLAEIEYVEYDGFDIDNFYVINQSRSEYEVYVSVVENFVVGYRDVDFDVDADEDGKLYGIATPGDETKTSSGYRHIEFKVKFDKKTEKVTRVEVI